MKKVSFYSFLVLFVQGLVCTTVEADQAAVECDPVVNLGAQATTLQKALSILAEQYDFNLIFPVDADRPVESVDSMTLSQSLKYLTADVNTVLQYEKVPGCAKSRLVSMEVLPVGEDTEYVYIKPEPEQIEPVEQEVRQPERKKPENKSERKSKNKKEDEQGESPSEGSAIENMDVYAEEVLLNQRRPDKNMTPEQLQEFREAKRQARMRLEADGVLEPRQNGRFAGRNKERGGPDQEE